MVQHADIDHTGLTGVGGGTHASSHQNAGGDEVSVAGLSGELADPQPPKTHAASHESGGGDEIDVTGLVGAGGGGGGGSIIAIGDPPSFAGSADKDFRGAVALTPYAAVGATTAGTVALRETSTSVDKYELTPSGILLQPGHGIAAELQVTYTLPDLQSMIMFGSFAPRDSAGDNSRMALELHGPSSTVIRIMVEQDTANFTIQGNSSIDTTGFTMSTPQWWHAPLWGFRICRDGLNYRSYVSLSGGLTWQYVDTDLFAAALTSVRFGILGASASQPRMHAGRILFVVEGHGDDAYDPW